MPDTVPTGGNLAGGMPVRPFADLRDTGLLWLINKVCLHPRGYALALNIDASGEATGWVLLGDGTEVWQFMPVDDDDGFAKVEVFLAGQKEAG